MDAYGVMSSATKVGAVPPRPVMTRRYFPPAQPFPPFARTAA